MAWSSDMSLLFFLSILFLFLVTGPPWLGVSAREIRAVKKLFVFGDSYADTGNDNKSPGLSSWIVPYGMTFPGKPSGRFSNGRVFTDYVAQHFGLETPVTYKIWKSGIGGKVINGMNFAFGGSGVFETLFPTLPTMTTQIGFFESVILDNVYNVEDLRSAIALVALSGNDYNAYKSQNGSVEGLKPFVQSVVKQLIINVKNLQILGVRNIIVNGLPALGCLPANTAGSSFTHCDQNANNLAIYHNSLLREAIRKLNEEHKDYNLFFLDLYNPFLGILSGVKAPGKFHTLLQPCCEGLTKVGSCGSVDKNGKMMYKVCYNPDANFFWDLYHPTQEGWRAVYSLVSANLNKFTPI